MVSKRVVWSDEQLITHVLLLGSQDKSVTYPKWPLTVSFETHGFPSYSLFSLPHKWTAPPKVYAKIYLSFLSSFTLSKNWAPKYACLFPVIAPSAEIIDH